MNNEASSSAVRPRHLQSQFAINGDTLTLVAGSSGRWFAAFFLCIWLCFWTVGCAVLAYKAITEPSPTIMMFGVPFWSSWFFVAGLVVVMLFQRDCFSLNSEGARLEKTILGFGSWQQLPLHEIVEFAEESKTDSEGSPIVWLAMRTRGRPWKLVESTPALERNWLRLQLQQHLKMLHAQNVATRPAWLLTLDQLAQTGERFRTGEGIPAGVEPPSDTLWQRTADFDTITLTHSGRWSSSIVAGVLFINLFWNSIVSFFVGMALGWFPGEADMGGWGRVGMLLFFIPFVVIGLLMLLGLVAVVFEPARRSVWNFGRHEMTFSLTWFGLGIHRHFPISGASKLVIERVDEHPKSVSHWRRWWANYHVRQDEMPIRYRVVLAGPNAVEAGSIEGLSLGEAEWVASLLQHERREWFA